MAGINPFGEQSDSIHAWKERYRQMEIQKNAAAQTLAETKHNLDLLTQNYNSLEVQYNNLSTELSEIRQELLSYRNIAKDRADKIQELESKLNVDALSKYKSENEELKVRVEELQMEIARGGISTDAVSHTQDAPDASRLYNALIPLILHMYDNENPEHADSFKNLIEVCIDEGDVLTQIIAILYKYGGTGPIDRVREMVKDKTMFSTAVDILVEEHIINNFDNELSIYVKGEDMSDISNWKSLGKEELINQLKSIMKTGQIDEVNVAIDNFRDIITERGVGGTMMFQIRKLKEGINKRLITRKEAINTLEEWKQRI